MAKMIRVWAVLGPRLEPVAPMESDELIENLIAATNQSRGSILALLSELDVQIGNALKAGRIVHLPNNTHYRPIGKRDGSIDINVRVNPELKRSLQALEANGLTPPISARARRRSSPNGTKPTPTIRWRNKNLANAF